MVLQEALEEGVAATVGDGGAMARGLCAVSWGTRASCGLKTSERGRSGQLDKELRLSGSTEVPGSGRGPLRARGSTGEYRAVAFGHLGHGDCGVPGSGGGPLRAHESRGGVLPLWGERRGVPRFGGPW